MPIQYRAMEVQFTAKEAVYDATKFDYVLKLHSDQYVTMTYVRIEPSL